MGFGFSHEFEHSGPEDGVWGSGEGLVCEHMVALFQLHSVDLRVGTVRILEGLSLEIPIGGVTAIIGPSGSGKSSLLRLLNRLEVPTGGSIEFLGQPLDQLVCTDLRRRVGMVFQRPALFEGTVADNLRVANPDLDQARMTESLNEVGLEPQLASREAEKLSGGEAQRLCLARSLLVGPEVLLLDEPTASLDQESIAIIENLLAKRSRQGLSLIWVSHDPEQVARIADRVIELVLANDGVGHLKEHSR